MKWWVLAMIGCGAPQVPPRAPEPVFVEARTVEHLPAELPSTSSTPSVGQPAETREAGVSFVTASELEGMYYVEGPCSCDVVAGVGVEALWSDSIDPMVHVWRGAPPVIRRHRFTGSR